MTTLKSIVLVWGLLLSGAVAVSAGEEGHRVHVRQAGGALELTLLGGGTYNLVETGLERKVRFSDCGLREAGFTGAPRGQNVNPGNSDELRIPAEGGDGSPAARILMDGEGRFVYWTGGVRNESAEEYVLDLSHPFVVRTTRSLKTMTWHLRMK